MESFRRSGQRNADDADHLVGLYEDGFKEIQAILADSDLTVDEQLDAIAEVIYDDDDEGDD